MAAGSSLNADTLLRTLSSLPCRASEKLAVQSLADWEVLLEGNRQQLMRRIDDVTTLVKVCGSVSLSQVIASPRAMKRTTAHS